MTSYGTGWRCTTITVAMIFTGNDKLNKINKLMEIYEKLMMGYGNVSRNAAKGNQNKNNNNKQTTKNYTKTQNEI